MKRVIFETPINKTGSYLRVRDEGGKITCTYKEQKEGDLDIYSIQELETEIKDFEKIEDGILIALDGKEKILNKGNSIILFAHNRNKKNEEGFYIGYEI